MAIISVIEQYLDRSAEGDWESLGLVRTWEVLTDNASDDEHDVSTGVDPSSQEAIPVKGAAHPAYSYATVQSLRVERNSLYRWFVSAIYGGGASNYEATKYIADVEWDVVESQEDIDYDIYGNAIANAAFERFEGIKATFFDQVLRITRTEASFDYAAARLYMRTLNADTFLGAPPSTAFMGPIRSRRIWESTGYTWRTTYNVFFREVNPTWRDSGGTQRGPWDARVLNEGYRVLNGTNSDGTRKFKELTEDGTQNSEKVSKPVLLSTDGTSALAANAPANFKYFTRYPLKAWAPLGLALS